MTWTVRLKGGKTILIRLYRFNFSDILEQERKYTDILFAVYVTLTVRRLTKAIILASLKSYKNKTCLQLLVSMPD